MNQKSVKFTTDTGSPVTIISEQTFNHIGAKYNDKPVKHRITVANSSTANILGYADIEIQIKNHHIKAEVQLCRKAWTEAGQVSGTQLG